MYGGYGAKKVIALIHRTHGNWKLFRLNGGHGDLFLWGNDALSIVKIRPRSFPLPFSGPPVSGKGICVSLPDEKPCDPGRS